MRRTSSKPTKQTLEKTCLPLHLFHDDLLLQRGLSILKYPWCLCPANVHTDMSDRRSSTCVSTASLYFHDSPPRQETQHDSVNYSAGTSRDGLGSLIRERRKTSWSSGRLQMWSRRVFLKLFRTTYSPSKRRKNLTAHEVNKQKPRWQTDVLPVFYNQQSRTQDRSLSRPVSRPHFEHLELDN